MAPGDQEPSVVISVPCPLCGRAAEPDPACARCAGHGIELLRVDAEEAVRQRSAGKSPRPDTGPARREH